MAPAATLPPTRPAMSWRPPLQPCSPFSCPLCRRSQARSCLTSSPNLALLPPRPRKNFYPPSPPGYNFYQNKAHNEHTYNKDDEDEQEVAATEQEEVHCSEWFEHDGSHSDNSSLSQGIFDEIGGCPVGCHAIELRLGVIRTGAGAIDAKCGGEVVRQGEIGGGVHYQQGDLEHEDGGGEGLRETGLLACRRGRDVIGSVSEGFCNAPPTLPWPGGRYV